MMTILIVAFGLMMIGAAFFSIYTGNLISAIISSGVISLLASIIYILLAAPDVAMTEAAIGSGLTTVVFLLALKRINKLRLRSTGSGSGSNSGPVSDPEEEALND